jgi:curved DNA-binding protein CbpA
MKLHPDRGGDPAKFQEIQAASEILLDPKKRAYYDKVLKRRSRGGSPARMMCTVL